VRALFVDYGQRARTRESAAACEVARKLGIGLATAKVRGVRVPEGAILGRNALLLDLALVSFEGKSGIVALGVHAGTDYPDCSPAFISKMREVYDLYTAGSVRIDAPFLNWSKRDIYDFALARDVPVGNTYSCEAGRKQPCGSCKSCKDIEALHAS
jgi:7-cyano-7-deazaguanine synthase